ncbi:F0F1 ATP synthase subunit B [Paenibacillus aurantius]|uniref:ATP synthase subunit b n=1 Tax=Paenibacillus aurantius TaxID=2918900 RepID=A0AA96LGH9_9BACL|nr:F0F1 ATP synthase subunit B [Paenibacillus aurantius]WJH36268.1 F0F1 ATP synthase subunit B [Paenibacillus sp. CC-CFT747]WNQ11551.1 F0F1 ATP synthase subunit B [Paenibacillus aurantius]
MHIVWSSFFIQLVAFLILFWLLKKYAFGPLFSIMEKRKELVQEQIQTAESNRKQTEQLLAEQKQAIETARKEAYDILEQARQTSGRQADELIQNAKAEAGRLKEEALKDIENEKNKAVAALRSQVSAMSVLIASKIIEKQVDQKSQEQLIDQYLQEVGGKQ